MAEEIKLENLFEPEWTDYVMSLLTETEKVKNESGKEYPKVSGLRRIVQKLIGPIISNKITQVAPSSKDDQRVTLISEIIINSRLSGEIVIQDGIGEVYIGNISNGFERFSAATAFSRAEAIAFRRLL